MACATDTAQHRIRLYYRQNIVSVDGKSISVICRRAGVLWRDQARLMGMTKMVS